MYSTQARRTKKGNPAHESTTQYSITKYQAKQHSSLVQDSNTLDKMLYQLLRQISWLDYTFGYGHIYR